MEAAIATLKAEIAVLEEKASARRAEPWRYVFAWDERLADAQRQLARYEGNVAEPGDGVQDGDGEARFRPRDRDGASRRLRRGGDRMRDRVDGADDPRRRGQDASVKRFWQRFARRLRCPHCGQRLGFFSAPKVCPSCGRHVYDATDRRRRH
jgi:rubrerythrin